MRFFGPPSGYRLTHDLGDGSPIRRDNRKRLTWAMPSLASLALLVFCLALASVPPVQAQSGEHSSRRVMRNANPNYPEVLKSKGIGGIVRLNAMVLANGTVANVEILGGNPILAASAVNAVMKWKYARAPSASNEIVTFEFNPH